MMMNHVGETFVFDYGDFVVKVRYLSERRLEWEQLQGPAVGTRAEEAYESVEIRPGVSFVWWQEADTSVVAQVVDFERGRVYTTWIPADRMVASFQGTIRPSEAPAPPA